jgi:hypothetical protein
MRGYGPGMYTEVVRAVSSSNYRLKEIKINNEGNTVVLSSVARDYIVFEVNFASIIK